MKNYKNYLAAGALLCSATLGAVAPAAVYADSTAEEEAVLSVVYSVKQHYYGPIIDPFNDENPDNQFMLEDTVNRGRIVYKPVNLKAGVVASKTFGVEASPESTIKNQLQSSSQSSSPDISANEAGEFLKQQLGFTDYTFAASEYPNQYINQNDGIICATYTRGTTCTHIDWNDTTDEWKSFLNGVGEAYYQKNGKYPIIFGDTSNNETLPTVENSEFGSYQNVTVTLFDGLEGIQGGLFYRSDATSPWVYFASTEGTVNEETGEVVFLPLSCSDYTGDAQKGFSGAVCMDTEGESEVTVPEEAEDESDVKVPNTGAATSDNKMMLAASSVAAIVTIGMIAYITAYTRNRVKHHVRFGKK